MKLAAAKPKAAHESALVWLDQGGGDGAVHCAAVALLGMGQSSQAARMMEELAGRTDKARTDLRAGLWAQAGNAWLIAGRPRSALADFDKAIKIRPDDAATLIDRSNARASMGQDWRALDDLGRALDLAPRRVDALIFRAGAWRRVGTLDLALQDIQQALSLSPGNPDALLERGLIRKARGDRAGARADWLAVIDHTADGPLRETARRHLEALDVKLP